MVQSYVEDDLRADELDRLLAHTGCGKFDVQRPTKTRSLVAQRQSLALGRPHDVEPRRQSAILDLEDVREVRVQLHDQSGLDPLGPEPSDREIVVQRARHPTAQLQEQRSSRELTPMSPYQRALKSPRGGAMPFPIPTDELPLLPSQHDSIARQHPGVSNEHPMQFVGAARHLRARTPAQSRRRAVRGSDAGSGRSSRHVEGTDDEPPHRVHQDIRQGVPQVRRLQPHEADPAQRSDQPSCKDNGEDFTPHQPGQYAVDA